MSSRIKKWLRSRKKQGAIEPSSLTPHPMVQEGKLGAVIAVPLLAGLMAILYIGKTYYVTEQEFMFLTGGLLALWVCFLLMVYSWAKSSATEYFLFDREFLFTERLHPRYEVYSKPHQILKMLGPEDKIEKPETLKERLETYGFPKQVTKQIKKMMKSKFTKQLYYFRHKDVFEGWDAEKNQRPFFQSHMVFMDKKFDEQFVFGQGQENWYGPIMYNHPHSESDIVKVMGWGLDPFTNQPMPICQLYHSSKVFLEGKPETPKQEMKLIDALFQVVASQHGIIESQRTKEGHLLKLLSSRLHDVKDVIKFGNQIARIDIKLWERIKKARSVGLWSKTWFKALVSIASIIGVVMVVALVLNFLGMIDLGGIFG